MSNAPIREILDAIDPEEAVLGSILIDAPHVLPVVKDMGLTRDHFRHTTYKRLYHYLLTMDAAHAPIGVRSVSKALWASDLLTDLGEDQGLAKLAALVDSTTGADGFARIHAQTMLDRANGPGPEPFFIRAADVQPRAVEWLWPGYIVKGAVNLMVGDPGMGKGFITLDLAARLSRGARMPDGSEGAYGVSLFLTGEDDKETTLRPRLDKAGGDQERVLFPSERPCNLLVDRDRQELEAEVQKRGATLLVLDPLSSFVPGLNLNSEADVRPVMTHLTRMAERTGCAVVAVRHLNKGEGGAMKRAGGSMAFVAAARAALIVGPDPNDGTRRVLATLKNNLSEHAPALTYSVGPPGGTGFVTWHGPARLTADDLVREPTGPGMPSARDTAKEYLRERLSGGPAPAEEVVEEAKARGIAKPTLDRAKKELNVVSRRSGPSWCWCLPDGGSADDHDDGGLLGDQ